MIMLKKQIVLFLFIALAAAGQTSLRAEEPAPMRVEGILFDAHDSSQSVAIVDGELRTAGSAVGEYEITTVQPDHVELRHVSSGETRILRAEKLPEQDPGPAPGELPVVNSSEAQGGTMFWRLLQKVLNSNTTLAEKAALSELRHIYVTAMTYLLDEGYEEKSLSLPTLVRKGLLSRDYEDSIKGAYRFSIKVVNGRADVLADPVEKGSKLRHFMLASDGTLYYDRGKPATKQSPFQNN